MLNFKPLTLQDILNPAQHFRNRDIFITFPVYGMSVIIFRKVKSLSATEILLTVFHEMPPYHNTVESPWSYAGLISCFIVFQTAVNIALW